jgi:hypothetical protein
MSSIDRRQFLKIAGMAGVAISGMMDYPLVSKADTKVATPMDLAVVHNGDPAMLVQRAIDMLGGISKFVKKGNVVVVKPNIGVRQALQKLKCLITPVIKLSAAICEAILKKLLPKQGQM